MLISLKKAFPDNSEKCLTNIWALHGPVKLIINYHSPSLRNGHSIPSSRETLESLLHYCRSSGILSLFSVFLPLYSQSTSRQYPMSPFNNLCLILHCPADKSQTGFLCLPGLCSSFFTALPDTSLLCVFLLPLSFITSCNHAESQVSLQLQSDQPEHCILLSKIEAIYIYRDYYMHFYR